MALLPATPSEPFPTTLRGTYLVRRNYMPRIVGVLLCGICLICAVSSQPYNSLHWLMAPYFMLVWPHLAYQWAMRSAHPLRAELINLWLDSLHAGFWIVAIQLSLVPSVALAMAVCLNNITVGGLRFLGMGLTGVLAGLLLGAGVWGWHIQLASDLNAQLGSAVLVMGYALLMGHILFTLATQLKLSRRELRHLSEHDALSGVHNRRYFDRCLAQTFSQFLRHPRQVTLLMCDVDDFKSVNDSHGHAVGDRVIVAVGKALSACARGGDVVARLGGDEFAVLLIDANEEQAMGYATRVQAELDDMLRAGTPSMQLRLSVGCVTAHEGLRDHGHWLERTDHAQYLNKIASRSRKMLLIDTKQPVCT